jgi:hypothetical protein
MMNKHVKRWLVALLAIAFVVMTGSWVYLHTSRIELGAGVALVVGVAFLHGHLCQLVRDQKTRFMSRGF